MHYYYQNQLFSSSTLKGSNFESLNLAQQVCLYGNIIESDLVM